MKIHEHVPRFPLGRMAVELVFVSLLALLAIIADRLGLLGAAPLKLVLIMLAFGWFYYSVLTRLFGYQAGKGPLSTQTSRSTETSGTGASASESSATGPGGDPAAADGVGFDGD